MFIPEHFGVVALFLAIVATIEPISAFCYDQASLLPKQDREAKGLIKLSSFSVAIVASVVLIAVVGLQFASQATELQQQLGKSIWLLPFAASLIGLNRVAENWRIRQKAFPSIARADIIQSLTTPLTRIGLGAVFGSSITALLIGYLAALVIRFKLLWSKFPLREIVRNSDHGFEPLKKLAREYREFPIYNAPAQFIRAFSKSLPVLVLGLLFSPAAAGFYAMANRLVGGPSEIVAGAVRRVYLRHAAERFSEGRSLGRFFIRITVTMFLLGLVPFSVLWFWGDELIGIFLGQNWSGAGRYAELLAAWFFVVWVSSPSAMLYVVMRQQKQWLVSQFALAVLRALALFLAFVVGASALQSVAAYVVVSITLNVAVVAYMSWYVVQYETDRVVRARGTS